MEIDAPTPPAPSDSGGLKASAEKSLHESRDYKALARRENKDALRALCQDHGLDDTLCKIELARQLIAWVSTLSLPHDNRNLICVAQHPSTSQRHRKTCTDDIQRCSWEGRPTRSLE